MNWSKINNQLLTFGILLPSHKYWTAHLCFKKKLGTIRKRLGVIRQTQGIIIPSDWIGRLGGRDYVTVSIGYGLVNDKAEIRRENCYD